MNASNCFFGANFCFLGVNLTKNELSFFGKIAKFSKPQNWKK
jgi:hypothetical protein